MHNHEQLLGDLNKQQREAVQAIDGPLLVLAGPGTGKTQLLSVRVANILQTTDTLAQNILCLTFTENGAANMRERLTSFIGQEAYNIHISTYHAFGGELIRSFPEYFGQTRLQSPVDDLGKRSIVAEIVEKMSYLNPLKQTRHHLGDLLSTLSEVKRGLLDSPALQAIAAENGHYISQTAKPLAGIFADFSTMPRTLAKALPYFEKTLAALEAHRPAKPVNIRYGSLADVAIPQLTQALTEAELLGKTTPLTKWKNSWLVKNSHNAFMLAGELQNQRMTALAAVLEQYQMALEKRGLYDFDDMILRSIQALEQHSDLKYTLQEQYLYLLLDEFQDTNAAQLRLVELLSDNPVHERRPNVMAVGDDDQAIYAFQGAQYSNMLDFYNLYRGVKTINLTENYRSHRDILHAAHSVAEQIEQRLHHQFEGMTKVLNMANKTLPAKAEVQRHEFLSDVAQYDWIAQQIADKIKAGVEPSTIAVLAPRHKHLEPLVGHLNRHSVPVRYEKRENILETAVIRQILTMSKLVLSLSQSDEAAASTYWPEVLSYEFWQLPVSDIWRTSWEVNDSRGQLTWTQVLLDKPAFHDIALLFLGLAGLAAYQTAETMLDALVGTIPVAVREGKTEVVQSPLRAYYTSHAMLAAKPQVFYETLSHLSVLRAKLREHQAGQTETLTLQDLLDFVDLYEAADERMINTSPYNQQANAVQLMTVFKAKGLEFDYVYLPSTLDEVWGENSRNNSNKLTLPANLAPIRHAGANQDERLRIFFVALTRAKQGLYLTSYAQSYSGKATKRLKYLNEQEQPDGSFASLALPKNTQANHKSDAAAPALEILEQNWQSRHIDGLAKTQLNDLLHDQLASYQLSPTHLNSFTDMLYGGPQAFFFNTILRFPAAPTPSGQFGNAIHETLQWVQQEVDRTAKLPKLADTKQYFGKRLQLKHLAKDETKRLQERGEAALEAYLKQRGQLFRPGDIAEHSFRNEGVFVGKAHLAGKIDRMEVDKAAKTITVVDYKTGKSYPKWASDLKLHKYRQQLYCYKLLIEQSHTYKGYRVESGRLEFIEPDAGGRIHSLELTFDDAELARVKQLLGVMWERVIKLDLPDISKYGNSLADSKRFEQDLLDGKV